MPVHVAHILNDQMVGPRKDPETEMGLHTSNQTPQTSPTHVIAKKERQNN